MSSKIAALFGTYGLTTADIKASFPDFNEADTVNVSIGEGSRQMNRAKVFTIKLRDTTVKNALLIALNKLPEVLYAETDGEAVTDVIPGDTRFGQQWNMRNTIVPGADIHAEAAWDIFTGNANAIIAIVDAGVDVAHNDLNGKINGGNTGFSINTDRFGRQFSHGTHVAGIAAATTDNANGVAGVDWLARIHPRYVIGNNTGEAGISQAIIDAVNFSPNVWTLNNSWELRNPDGTSGLYSVTIRQAFAHAYRNNRVSCIAMGNHHTGLPDANDVTAFPAGINSGVIAVGATDINDGVAGFSARGLHIDVSAPGVDIVSTTINNDYIDESGTSMATPHVSGLASLLKGFDTNLANDDIEQIIRLTADDANVNAFPGFDNQMGTGRINAQRALQTLVANTLQQLSTTGGTVFSTSASMSRVFLGFPGLPDAAYFVKRSEVRTNITFNSMCNVIGVWGRGVGTTGYREENGRCFGEGICEVVPGTLTNTGATLRTSIYEVWTSSGQYLGFYPNSAQNVTFQYTILGVAAPTAIDGNAVVCNTENFSLNAAIPSGSVVSWTSTPAGYVNISATTPNWSSVSVQKLSSGDVTLTASVPGCSAAVTVNRTIRVGGYSSSDYAVSGSYSACTNSDVYFNTNVLPGATNYQWFWPSDWTYVSGQGTPYLSLRTGYSSGGGSVGVRVANQCDAGGSPSMQYVQVYDCGYYYYSMSPNPATSTVTVTTKVTTAKGEKVDKTITELNIYDQQGNLKKRQKFGKVNTATMNIADLQTGVYFIEIVDGIYKERQQLSVLR